MNTRASLPPGTPSAAGEPHSTRTRVPTSQLALYFLRLGTLGFGGFIKGTYGAAIGTILGACVLLGKIAIGDVLTALVALGALGLLFRFKISNRILIGAAAVIALVAYPLLQPQWTRVR